MMEATKIKKKRPQTLNDRLEKLCNKYSIPVLTKDQKLELGKITAQSFYKHTEKWEGRKPYLMTREIEEDSDKFRVRLYPSFFIPTLDALIFEYLKQQNIYVRL